MATSVAAAGWWAPWDELVGTVASTTPPAATPLPASAPSVAPTAVPLPPGPTSQPSINGCLCKPGKCPGRWPSGAPGPCKAGIPDQSYRLRLSHVTVLNQNGRLTSLFDEEPTARLCIRVAGTATSQPVCITRDTVHTCGSDVFLVVTRDDLLRHGLDVTIDERNATVTQGRLRPRSEGVLQSALCDGLKLETAGAWPLIQSRTLVRSAHFFLDPT